MSENVKQVSKPYEFRKLKATDIAPMCKIIGKIGINNFTKCFDSDEILAVLKKEKSAKNLTELAGLTVILDIANIIITHVPECEKEIFTLIASVSGLTVDEIKEFDIAVIAEMIIDFVKKDEFKDFIGVVSKLFK